MAVYASLVSLIHVINRTQNPPSPYAFLEKLQTQPLLDQVSFLLEFVEDYSQTSRRSNEIELLESRIAAAAYEAEDIIETFVVDQIKRKSAQSSTTVDNSYAISSEGLEKVVQEMDLIMKEVLKIKADHMNFNEKNQQQQQDKHSIEAASGSSSLSSSINVKALPPPTGGKKNTMVGFDDDLIKLKEKLTTHQSGRLVISITGMGGIGKTTLATNTYDDPFVKNYFDIRAWVTISQDFSLKKVILGLLYDTGNSSHENLELFSDGKLGEILHKVLFERKYLIVLDDIWSITAWDEISKFLPDNGNGSRIIITTRLSVLALSLGSSLNSTYQMKFLDDDISWNLLSETVFGGRREQVCPPELEKIGRIIAKNCQGLPLAIIVIGGLLKMSEKTREYWSEVAENVSSIVNEENDDQCLRILSLSYNQLPIQLNSLFLYIAIFPEDSEISVSDLIKLWVAEGFLKPPAHINKTLEEIAEKYFKDLIDRNLIIMVQKRGSRCKIKTCKIHDLLRDLCLREAQKERFFCVERMYGVTEGLSKERRLGMHSNELLTMPDLQLMSLARTVVMDNSEIPHDIIFNFDLLRVVHADEQYEFHRIMELVNLRYLKFSLQSYYSHKSVPFDEMSSLPWNLETLIVNGCTQKGITLPSEIWEMQHLRHIKFEYGVYLSNPDGENHCVLNNLQTLSKVLDFRFTDEILGRIPNLKKLSFTYNYVKETEEEMSRFHYNLVRLQKLDILKCKFYTFNDYSLKICLTFPPTLRKLSLSGSRIPWENMNIVGSLPNLEVLSIGYNAFCGSEWNSTDHQGDQFQCLKSLEIFRSDLQIWRADNINFPALERLVLQNCKNLEEIPWDIGEIPSLELITLVECKKSLVISAKEIHLEAQAQGNNDLLIQVYYISDEPDDDEMHSLESHNFEVEKLYYSSNDVQIA